jgi:hypothetical protein
VLKVVRVEVVVDCAMPKHRHADESSLPTFQLWRMAGLGGARFLIDPEFGVEAPGADVGETHADVVTLASTTTVLVEVVVGLGTVMVSKIVTVDEGVPSIVTAATVSVVVLGGGVMVLTVVEVVVTRTVLVVIPR